MSKKQMKILGWVATFHVCYDVRSFLPQIMNNLAGQRKSLSSSLVAADNCVSGSTMDFSK